MNERKAWGKFFSFHSPQRNSKFEIKKKFFWSIIFSILPLPTLRFQMDKNFFSTYSQYFLTLSMLEDKILDYLNLLEYQELLLIKNIVNLFLINYYLFWI